MNYIAPAGTPLSLWDLSAGLGAGLRGDGAARALARTLATQAGQPHAWLMSSGRAGMTFMLRAMKTLAPATRDEVVVPGYTCYSVAASAELAGLKVRLCDVDPRTLSPDPAQLRSIDLSRVLCIVSANLYGIPNALDELEAIARAAGVFMLDDAAQALGATRAGRPVGGFGDAGLFSFDKGKIITTLQGGALVARPGALAAALSQAHEKLPAANAATTLTYSLKLGVYSILLRPSLYGMVQRIPALGLGRTVYENDYPVARFSDTLAGLALRLVARLERLNAGRSANARALREALSGVRGVTMPEVPASDGAVWCRFALFVSEASKRAGFIKALNAAGIGATASYPNALVDVPEVARLLAPDQTPQDGARTVANTIVTLPTHGYCPPDLPRRVRDIAERALA